MGDGTQEWDGVTTDEDIPTCINPEQGWLTNWNNKPIADWPYAESDIHWGEGHRVQILMDAMAGFAASGDLTTDTLNTLNQIAGYHSTGGMSFAGNVIEVALASTNATLKAAGSYLAAWATATPLPISRVDFVSPKWPTDPDPTYDHPGLTIFNEWYDRIFDKVFTGILPSDLISEVKKYPSLLIRVFREDPSLLYLGYPSGPTLTTMIEDALKEAVDYLTSEYGADMSTWLTPVRMQEYGAQGALPGGDYHPYMNRGTYNQIAEMLSKPPSKAKASAKGKGRPPLAVSVIPPGQSGFVSLVGMVPTPSPHAFDQLPLYAAWQYKQMLFRSKDIEAVETWRRVF